MRDHVIMVHNKEHTFERHYMMRVHSGAQCVRGEGEVPLRVFGVRKFAKSMLGGQDLQNALEPSFI